MSVCLYYSIFYFLFSLFIIFLFLDEIVLCYHQELLYKAKILDICLPQSSFVENSGITKESTKGLNIGYYKYLIHYYGWSDRYGLFLKLIMLSAILMNNKNKRNELKVLLDVFQWHSNMYCTVNALACLTFGISYSR